MKRSPLGRKTPLKKAQSLTRRVIKAKRAKVTPAERLARRLVRARSGGVCEVREVCRGATATNFHHRLPRSQGGPWSASNGLDVCGSGTTGCHGVITLNPALAKEPESGWSVASHQDPAAVPVRLAGRGLVLLTDTGEIQEIREAGNAA